jgi:Tfp pilus assembly protein PilX
MMSAVRSRLTQRGAALVEAAILLIPLLIIVLGIAEGGRMFFQYNSIAQSTRDAARYLSTVEAGNAYGQHDIAKCLAVYGNVNYETRECVGTDPLVPGLSTSNVVITEESGVTALGTGGPVMNLVKVTVEHFTPQPFIDIVMPSFEFGPISTTMRQAL